MEKQMEIKYAPDTIFITGGNYEEERYIIILNSKNTGKNKYGELVDIQSHCQKCNEQVLSILN